MNIDLNINYCLHPHGWSNCKIIFRGIAYDMAFSHVVNNPIEECLNSLLAILQGEAEKDFYWYDEPGGVKIKLSEMPQSQEIMRVEVDSFYESSGERIKNYKKEIALEVKKTCLIILFYFEFKKIQVLLEDRDYALNRQGFFPFSQFRSFEKIVKDYLEIE